MTRNSSINILKEMKPMSTNSLDKVNNVNKMSSEKIYEKIAEHIKQQILNGDLLPGQRLPSVKELCELYGVSRSTVREALSALKIMGLIETRQGEGSTVSKINPADLDMPDFQQVLLSEKTILELAEARKTLELSNAELAAQKRTNEDLKKFQEILNKMELNLLDKNEIECEKLDIKFHFALAQSTQNSIIVRLLDTISSPLEKTMREIRKMSYSNPEFTKNIFNEHHQIYLAILNQDSLAAKEWMSKHLLRFEEEIGIFRSSR
jgi:GntR family transcriptional regulator, transcriptional repressor for pyruvate dehydrogenase complex